MRNMKAVTFGLLLASGLIYSGAAVSATGTVILRDKDNAICSLPVPEPGTRKLYSLTAEDSPCKGWNDRARTFQLAEAPSATLIMLINDHECASADHLPPWFHMKTIKKQTNTSIMEIEYLATFKENQIIEPGLQMVKLATSPDGNRNKISCVSITTSAAPPSPSSTTP